MRSGSQDKSLPADHRLCPPGMRVVESGSLLQLPPGMIARRVLSKRREHFDEAAPRRHRERGRDADVVEVARVVVQAEQERADRVARVLVPAKAGDRRNPRCARASPSACARLPGVYVSASGLAITPSRPAPSNTCSHSSRLRAQHRAA
jgi:hypothetical protein